MHVSQKATPAYYMGTLGLTVMNGQDPDHKQNQHIYSGDLNSTVTHFNKQKCFGVWTTAICMK